MAEPENKKRRPNFSNEELHALIAAVAEKKNILLAKFDMKVSSKTKNTSWDFVANQVNMVSRVHRDLAEVRKKFFDFRAIVKKKAAS